MTKIGSKPAGGLDPKELQELEELRQQMATQAAAGIGPQVEGANQSRPTGRARGDRKGAQAIMSQGAQTGPRTESAQAATGVRTASDIEADKQLEDALRKAGYLPKEGPVSQKQLEEATRKFLTENMDKYGDMDIEQLMSMIESMLQKRNARANNGGGARPGAPAPRPGMLPPQSSVPSGPAANQGQLQAAAAQAMTKPPPEPGSINAKVAQAAQQYMGTSTRAGPDGGNLACAWSVNNILSNAGLQKVGSNPNYVPSVEQALNGGRGTRIDPKDMKPGDIVIWPNGHHIGIGMGDGKVANNSSSRAAFVNLQSLPAGARVYRLNS